MLELGVKLLLSYLLGSCNGALLLGRLRGIDIRNQGSGNAGGTNALRTQGLGFAFAVIVIDVGKGALAVLLVAALALPGLTPSTLVPASWVPPLCGAAAILGHVYPFWFQMRGGKGAGTLIGAYAALMPSALIPLLLVWIVVLITSGFVGLSTMLAAISVPLYLNLSGSVAADSALLVFSMAMAALILLTHRSNIQRMLRGTEDKKRRMMLFSRGR